MTTAARLILVSAAAATLAGCAGAPRSVAGLAPACDIGATGSGVTVTARGTQLALRAALAEPRLQRIAFENGSGSAVLSCRPADGVLRRCVVLYEEPGSQGYGKLALAWADRVIWPSDVEAGTAEVRFRFDGQAAGAARLCR